MTEVQEYPKWVEVEGDGHPDQPGHVLVEDADEEAALAKPKRGRPAKSDEK